MPTITGLLETALYVDDKQRSVRFFRDIMGLTLLRQNERFAAFDAGSRGVLLIFKRGASRQDMPMSTGIIPGHDGVGPLHMAFAIPASSYDEWADHLRALAVRERGEMHWDGGGRSFYFEDPDGNVLELATPGIWPNY